MDRSAPPSGRPALATAAYGAGQLARVGWYLGHYIATRRWLSRVEGGRRPRRSLRGRLVGARIHAALTRRAIALMARDLANVRAGIYPLPADLAPRPLAAGLDAARYWHDLPEVALRRRRRRHGDATGTLAEAPGDGRLPDYYRQSFHDQSGGWLTGRSAALYDTQVEVLFGGLAGAMRRQALPPVADWLAARGAPEGAGLLDLGTGTGAMLATAAEAFPALALHGLDLSAAYLARARDRLADRPVRWHEAAAEAIPLPDASVDLVTAVYLLHELPPAVRAAALAEAARVLRPGGRLVVVDSIQLGDAPALDPLLRGFPEQFHEPYYADWVAADVPALLTAAGLVPAGTEPAYLSKVWVADRP
ncbi:methyltransferase [Thalassobaculum fulvum]|uniref:Methyltransferase n=1 Tax=Thalassobaculum fulvum TaxID=1633335 RepID=A0A918XN64_9PROT|nr:class I SAM-dependent methyltransferase [Thalassobaculum fulvum]GHD39311.1 methyltransferase [Thalassobaculum fulvum]